MTKTYDILGFGNAVMDYIADAPYSLIAEFNLVAGHGTEASTEEFQNIHDKLPQSHAEPGGAVANSIVVAAKLGASAAMIAKSGDDADAKTFQKSIEDSQADYFTSLSNKQNGTTKTLALITPDQDRTFVVHSGAGADYDVADLREDLIQNSKILYMEGYALNAPEGEKTLNAAADMAKKHDTKFAFVPNDANIIAAHRDCIEQLLEKTDILFLNEEEARAIAQTDDLDIAIDVLKDRVETISITKGGQGSLLIHNGDIHDIATAKPPGDIVNTSGAGDNYAGAILYCLSQDIPLAQAGKIAAKIGAMAVTHQSPRPQHDIKKALS